LLSGRPGSGSPGDMAEEEDRSGGRAGERLAAGGRLPPRCGGGGRPGERLDDRRPGDTIGG